MNAIKKSNYWKRLVNHRLIMQERLLLLTGVLGIVLGGICLLIILVRGAIVLPEGDLFKAVSFDIAIGIFTITTAILLPSINIPASKKRVFRWTIIVSTLYSYGVETIQHMRGLNPRFSQAEGVLDNIFGGVFGLVSLLIIIMYVMLTVYIFHPKMLKQSPLFTIGLRYGIISTLLAFAAGVWMIVLQGRFIGMEGNIIWLHGLGFHGLQAMPILSWLVIQTSFSEIKKAKLIHWGGLGWNLSILMVGTQTALGRTLFELSYLSLTFYFLLTMWLTLFIVLCWEHVKARKIKWSTISKNNELRVK
jgi:hypothetical protein